MSGLTEEERETFFWDRLTGEPCPRIGNLLCALPYDPDHLHTHSQPNDAAREAAVLERLADAWDEGVSAQWEYHHTTHLSDRVHPNPYRIARGQA